MSYPIHTEQSAPPEAKATLATIKAEFGIIPNLEAILATSPPVLEAYSKLWQLFETTSLSPIERQVVYQSANYHHDCHY